VHESVVGTKRTWRDVRLESVMSSKADIAGLLLSLVDAFTLIMIQLVLFLIAIAFSAVRLSAVLRKMSSNGWRASKDYSFER
jgi:hypothetical protein